MVDLHEVPARKPPESPLAPQWYKLESKTGKGRVRGTRCSVICAEFNVTCFFFLQLNNCVRLHSKFFEALRKSRRLYAIKCLFLKDFIESI